MKINIISQIDFSKTYFIWIRNMFYIFILSNPQHKHLILEKNLLFLLLIKYLVFYF